MYARFRFLDGNNVLHPEQIKKFLDGSLWALEPYVCRTAYPFLQPISELTSGCTKSTIIIQFDNDKHIHFRDFRAKQRLFFTKDELQLDGDTAGNEDTGEKMIANQHRLRDQANNRGANFALWLAHAPFSGDTFSAELSGNYHKLRDITRPINQNLRKILEEFPNTLTQTISAVFLDWFEDGPLVDLAIERSIGRPFGSDGMPNVFTVYPTEPFVGGGNTSRR